MDKESVYVLDESGRIAYVLMERLMIFLSLKVMGVLLTLFLDWRLSYHRLSGWRLALG